MESPNTRVRPWQSPNDPWAEGNANRPHRPLARPRHSQRVHPGQPPEGPIRQPADVVPLQLQHFQAVQPLERQALDQPDPIPIEVPKEIKPVGSERLACTPHLQPFPQSLLGFQAAGKIQMGVPVELVFRAPTRQAPTLLRPRLRNKEEGELLSEGAPIPLGWPSAARRG